MTLRSLELLRESADVIYPDVMRQRIIDLADEIQAEIDRDYVPRSKALYDSLVPIHISDWCMEHQANFEDYIDHFYLPRPLFEDGEPLQWGDWAVGESFPKQVAAFLVTHTGGYTINGIRYPDGKDVKRPSAPDTQERIDEDALIFPAEYCAKHGLKWVNQDTYSCRQMMTMHLLERQRNLDKREREA